MKKTASGSRLKQLPEAVYAFVESVFNSVIRLCLAAAQLV